MRRVVLYKNGVGYFEQLGRVRGSQDVHVDFTSAQLNDVLKSLTVLDLSGGRVTGVDCIEGSGPAANDHFHDWSGRTKSLGELHQRSPHLENNLSHRATFESG